MDTNGHYRVIRGAGKHIIAVSCVHCPFIVRLVRRSGDRSGLPKYNRARAAMVRHLHLQHRQQLVEGLQEAQPITSHTIRSPSEIPEGRSTVKPGDALREPSGAEEGREQFNKVPSQEPAGGGDSRGGR